MFFALGGPGRNDTHGAWMYVRGISFIAFLLTAVTVVVLGLYLLTARRRERRAGVER